MNFYKWFALKPFVNIGNTGGGGGSGGGSGDDWVVGDGKTRLYINISAEGRMNVPLCFSQTVANGVTIDWGDGTATETVSGTGTVNAVHTYTNIGEYCITLDVADGCKLGLGHKSTMYCVMGVCNNNRRTYSNMLKKAEIGKGVASIDSSAFYHCGSLTSVVIPESVTSIYSSAFYNCHSLTSVVIPSSVTSVGNDAFCYCCSLTSVVIPEGVTSINANTFVYCYSLTSVVIPESVTSIGNSAFKSCYSLTSVVIPESVTSIGDSAFYQCYLLTSIVIPEGVTSINTSTFSSCYSLTSVVIPESVTSIGNSAFYGCNGMKFYDFTKHTVVPTLSSTNAFDGIPSDCEIRVPSALYDEWISATNWSTYASKIVAV